MPVSRRVRQNVITVAGSLTLDVETFAMGTPASTRRAELVVFEVRVVQLATMRAMKGGVEAPGSAEGHAGPFSNRRAPIAR